jgi:putative transposase
MLRSCSPSGIEVSYETIRCWTRKFGQLYAWNLRRSRCKPTGRWHLDEMVVKVGGMQMWLWRAVDDEGEVLDVLLQKRRNKGAAMKLLRKLLKSTGLHPETITTDGLASYRAAMRELALTKRHRPGGMRANNRAEGAVRQTLRVSASDAGGAKSYSRSDPPDR